MKNIFKIYKITIFSNLCLVSFANAENLILNNNQLTAISSKPLANSSFALSCNKVSYNNICSLAKKSKGKKIRSTNNGHGDTEGIAIATDKSGNVYVTGSTTVGINGQQLQGEQDYFIIKYSASGQILWTQEYGVADDNGIDMTGSGIVIDNAGNIYLSGYKELAGYTKVAANTQLPHDGYEAYGFVAKYDLNGKIQWMHQIGDAYSNTKSNGITIDNANNVYITGYTGAEDFNRSALQHDKKFNFFLMKYDTNGILQWTQKLGPVDSIGGSNLVLDNNNNIYATGWTSIGINGQKQQGSIDYFVVKYYPNGKMQWSRQSGAEGGYTYGNSITLDNSNNIYITGDTDTGINGQIQQGDDDYFVVKYDPSGNIQWTQQVGAVYGNTYGRDIVTDSSGNIYITGSTDIGINGQQGYGDFDYFIVKYYPNGKPQWTQQIGVYGGETRGNSIAINNNSNLYITGTTTVGINGQSQNGANDVFIAAHDVNDGGVRWGKQVGG